ncbi:hypothetical protein LS71_002270 [Helicobacter jaachi]|uniref:Tetratricopeptide repeat protein n=1 Tax=Helicobacter jaachi TaxID=1677920 RepID=A0A4V6I2W4_9HELI|nr:hypothetical protein [Helicobacter jaachi]TLD97592.1 hypothetical protein LS71_002270 [Helicobacter jaachi]
MSIKTTLLAQIYEMQGLKEDALKIYRDILSSEPDNREAQAAIERLLSTKRHFPSPNLAQLELFSNPRNEEDLLQFQRWLLEWTSKI